jgi:hypothetical protein
VAPEKFSVIENGYDEEAFSGLDGAAAYTGPAPGEPVKLLHSGLLYTEGRDPSAFFEALSRLKAQGKISGASLQVVLRAPGEAEYFAGLVSKYSVQDIIRIEAAVPYKEALAEMLKVDGLLIFQGSAFNTQIPAKIYEYFRARRPIFGLLDTSGETAKALRSAGFDDLASMTNADEIAAALEHFLTQVKQGKAAVASDELVAGSSRLHRARQLAGLFDEIASAAKR